MRAPPFFKGGTKTYFSSERKRHAETIATATVANSIAKLDGLCQSVRWWRLKHNGHIAAMTAGEIP